MLNRDIQQIRINVLEVLISSCKRNPSSAYEKAEEYLKTLQESLIKNKDFYEQEYKG